MRSHDSTASIALEKCARDAPHHVLRKCDGSVIEADMDGGAINRAFADMKYTRWIEHDIAELQVEGFSRTGRVSIRLLLVARAVVNRVSRSRQEDKTQGQCQAEAGRRRRHFRYVGSSSHRC